MGVFNYFCKVHNISFGIWILKNNAADILLTKINFKNISNFNLDPKGNRSSMNAGNCLRVKFLRQNKSLPFVMPLL